MKCRANADERLCMARGEEWGERGTGMSNLSVLQNHMEGGVKVCAGR